MIYLKEGWLIRKDGSIKKEFRVGKNGYLFVSLRLPLDKRGQVSIHKLQAYKKFGELMFKPNMVVRHIDGDKLNNKYENISIGTQSENQLDRCSEDLKLHSIKAARKNQDNTRPLKTRLEIYEMIYKGLSTREIMNKYSIAKSTIYNMKKNSIEYKEYVKNKSI